VNWEGSVIRDRLVKKWGIGSFAECNTRQRDALPSVDPKHSAKRPISVILGTFFAECFVFAECIQMDTRQSDHKNLPVARLFAECIGRDTRQSVQSLPSVLVLALGKLYNIYRVFCSWHSANFRNFAECFGADTR